MVLGAADGTTARGGELNDRLDPGLDDIQDSAGLGSKCDLVEDARMDLPGRRQQAAALLQPRATRHVVEDAQMPVLPDLADGSPTEPRALWIAEDDLGVPRDAGHAMAHELAKDEN